MGGFILDPALAAFDVDGVVADIVTPFIRLLEERHGVAGLTLDHITDFDLEKALGLPRAMIDDVVHELVDRPLEAGVRLYPGAAAVLEALIGRGSVLFVTARHDADLTREWLEILLPDLPSERWEVVATGDPMAKLDSLVERNRSVFFDDNVDTCRQLHEAGLRAYIFDQPWNRAGMELPRVKGWPEVARLFGLGDNEG